MLSVPARADDDKHILTYEVYTGGFNAVLAKLHMDHPKKDRYKASLFVRTKGFLGSLLPWHGSFKTEGWLAKEDIRKPELHTTSATWKGETEVQEYAYEKNGAFKQLTITKEGIDKSPKEIDTTLTKDSIDALTAALDVMTHVSDGNKCEGESIIFDGRRRFKLLFRDKGTTFLKANRYNIFEGEATECVAEIEPLGGNWHKKPRGWLSVQEQGRKLGSLPTIWLARVGNTKQFLPVKIRVKTDYGTLFAHLTKYENDKGLVKQAAMAE